LDWGAFTLVWIPAAVLGPQKGSSTPAFNFLLKTLAPSVYIILISTGLYAFKQQRLVNHIWLVVLYYFTLRLAYNLIFSRAPLLNWLATLTQIAVGSAAAYAVYRYLILPKRPLFPGADSIGDQLWVIIALFLYAILNNVQVATRRTVRRKNMYLRSRLQSLRQEYGPLIDGQFPERYMELVTYAILIYETFNRPLVAQFIERLVFPWGSHTLGPMQVRTEKRISDKESVFLGVGKVRLAFEETNRELGDKKTYRYEVIRKAVAKYNRDENYVSDVFEVLHILWAQVAPEYRTDFEHMYSL
jgi:hypothetical protein